MNIGIIVHSLSGNTYSVAHKLQDQLIESGHDVTIERIQVVGGENPQNLQFQLENPPDITTYDAVIFGAPVRGFNISPVMKQYLNQIVSLEGKKAACYVTKTLPSKWTGGNKAVKGMKSLCEAKGGNVAGIGVVFWKRNREKSIQDLVNAFSKLF